MKIKSINRELEIFKFSIKEHFSCYKRWYILFSIIIIVGIVIGIFVGYSMRSSLAVNKIPEKIFVSFLQEETNLGNLLFSRFLSVLTMVLAIFIFCLKPWSGVLSTFIVAYRSFVLGVTIAVLVLMYNIVGVLNVLLLVLPCYILMLLIISSFGAVCLNYSFTSRSYGGCVFSREFWCTHKKTLFVQAVLMFILLILEIILLPLLAPTLIVQA